MDFLKLITQAVATARYPVIFLAFFIDANSTNFIASGVAATGILNIWIIWASAIVIEIIVDLFYYHLGTKLSDTQIANKVARGEGSRLLDILDKAYKKHPGITLMIVKCLGPFAIPGILYMGKTKALDIPKFLEFGAIVAITRGTLLSFLGYMVGKGLSQYMKLYDLVKVLGIVLIVVVVLAVIYKMYQKQIEEWFFNIFKKIK